jgi:hypothetical protein
MAGGLGPHGFPARLVEDSKVRGGLRVVELGEDDDTTFAFLGHQYHRDVLAAIEYIAGAEGYGWDAEDMPEPAELLYTYARLDETCQGHTGVPAACDCGWSLEWSTATGDRLTNRGRPGYFPVVIWAVDA